MTLVSDINAGRETLSRLIHQSRHCVVFTGAGMSTESGIPDFRSPGGIWSRMDPIEFDEFVSDESTRLEDWRRRFEMNEQFSAADPNSGHHAIATLVGRGKVAAVITQNIDGLHQRAGCPSEIVIELHGNATFGACLNCGARHELDEVRAIIARSGLSPRCDSCGGLVKSAVINFGQAMPVEAMERALDLAETCDLFVVAGSSLAVQPAASLPLIASRQGAHLVIINRDPTPLDDAAEYVLRGNIGEFLEDIA
ncbi:SIR2 family NAD-dependent protein deacylase [Breoghania corrubedonensis]|nr:Sir2 family NAD-dependent protein deacetylase [Breoghania corrubedonensis]